MTSTPEGIDITPEDSVVPVFFDTSPQVPIDDPFEVARQEQEKADRDLASAIAKLAKFGLTEDEGRALAGR